MESGFEVNSTMPWISRVLVPYFFFFFNQVVNKTLSLKLKKIYLWEHLYSIQMLSKSKNKMVVEILKDW